jgi:hypothetical protein
MFVPIHYNLCNAVAKRANKAKYVDQYPQHEGYGLDGILHYFTIFYYSASIAFGMYA